MSPAYSYKIKTSTRWQYDAKYRLQLSEYIHEVRVDFVANNARTGIRTIYTLPRQKFSVTLVRMIPRAFNESARAKNRTGRRSKSWTLAAVTFPLNFCVWWHLFGSFLLNLGYHLYLTSFLISHGCKEWWWRIVAERTFVLVRKCWSLKWGHLLFVFRKYIYTHILNG